MSGLFDLTGKVVLITGGSRGLGLVMAKAFAEHGADLIIASRQLDACTAAAQEIEAATGRRAVPVACHVGRWADCDALIERSYAEFGRVDVLVNNAGMSPLYDSLDTVTEALWDKVIGVNAKGPFRLAALVAQRMAEGAGGSIINISSAAAVHPTVQELPYAMAKLSLHALSQGIAHAYRGRVRANVIMPGVFETDISKAWSDEAREQFQGMVAMGRIGDRREIIGAALYLASDAASYTTGAVIKVDGGLAYG